jgi:hypothetical protein
MAEGGGFCERHGPFDPPHRTCPYCALEDPQRRAFGPPSGAAGDAGRRTLDAPPAGTPQAPSGPELTEMRPADEEAEAPPYEGPQPLAWLIVKEPEAQRGTMLALAHNQVIGREGDLRWDDPRLSRQHARVTVEPPAHAPESPPLFHLWPFGPTNPIFINGEEVRGATPLYENDEIRLGDTLFVFKTLAD